MVKKRLMYLGTIAVLILSACSFGDQPPAAGTMEVSFEGSDRTNQSATLAITTCERGVIAAEGPEEEWRVHLDEDRGGSVVSVVVEPPGDDRFEGILDEAADLDPTIQGSGSAELHPAGRTGSAPVDADLSWDC